MNAYLLPLATETGELPAFGHDVWWIVVVKT